jgi:hypothetical protein
MPGILRANIHHVPVHGITFTPNVTQNNFLVGPIGHGYRGGLAFVQHSERVR